MPNGRCVAIRSDAFEGTPTRAVVIVEDRRPVGILDINALRGMEHIRWPHILVDDVMTPIAAVATVSPQDELVMALERLDGSPLLPVVSDGALVGVLYPESVIEYLRTREALNIVRAGAAGQP